MYCSIFDEWSPLSGERPEQFKGCNSKELTNGMMAFCLRKKEAIKASWIE
jgi:hypothetical protein